MLSRRAQQRFLKEWGFYSGTPNGKDTKAYHNSVKEYQRVHNLVNDGSWGPKTQAQYEKDVDVYENLKKGYISPHFKKTEFKCGCKGKLCDGYNSKEPNMKLILILEVIRTKFGLPVVLTSGVRCDQYNAKLSGSISKSEHRNFKAADIYIHGVTNKKSGRKDIEKLAYELGAKYVYHSTPNMGNAVHINV